MNISIWRLQRTALFTTLTAFGIAHSALAQRDVVFQHGLRSDSTTWIPEAARLSSVFAITPFRPTVNASAVFSTQAPSLASQVTMADADAILVGHSDGGLVGRAANMPSPWPGRAWGGIVTIGTPHGGAQLAASAVNGPLTDWIVDLGFEAVDAINYYINIFFDNTVTAAIAANDDLVNLTGDVLADLAAMEIGVLYPVTGDITPGSAFLGILTTNLSREAVALPVRIGITSTVSSNTGLLWKGLRGSNWSGAHNTQVTIASAFLEAGFTAAVYNNPDDPNQVDINANAWRFLDAGADIQGMDDDWCLLIGAWNLNACGASDGIVPAAAQAYPGAANTSISGPSHIEETNSSQTDIALKAILATSFGVDSLSAAPPLAVTIEGPTLIQPGATCAWSAEIADGTAPYTYEWESQGQGIVGHDQFYVGAKDPGLGATFSLTVTATDALGARGEVQLLVTEDSSAPVCSFSPSPVRRPPAVRLRP